MAGLKAFEKQFIRDAVVDEARLREAKASASGGFSGDAIVQLGFADAEAVYPSLARFCELRYVPPGDLEVGEAILKRIPARLVTHYRCVPAEERDGEVVFARARLFGGGDLIQTLAAGAGWAWRCVRVATVVLRRRSVTMSTLMRLAFLGCLVCMVGAALLYALGLAVAYFMENGIIAH